MAGQSWVISVSPWGQLSSNRAGGEPDRRFEHRKEPAMTEPRAANANDDQVAYWNAVAGETWVAMQDRLDGVIEPLGARAIAALAPAPGERVIDVGCGCGQTSLALAAAVGPTGAMLGADVSRPMLAVARRRAADLPQASFIEADAQTHAFAPGGFDAVFSRFGVMFFADPTAAFANLRRALRSGGRLAFVCWRAFAENAWMLTPMAAALQHLPEPPPPPDPLAPGPFAFADAERLRGILAGAGFAQIDIAPDDQAIGSPDIDQALEITLKVGPLGSLLREQPDKAPLVIDAVRASLEPYVRPQGVRLPSATWIVQARAP
jgi:SAM-dependent methyltransferase